MLLVGPCDSGKTTLFLQLRDGSTHFGTVASMRENVAEGVALAGEKGGHARPVALVDIPGHPRLRGACSAQAIVSAGQLLLLPGRLVVASRCGGGTCCGGMPRQLLHSFHLDC